MNPQMQTEAQVEWSTDVDLTVSETDLLAGAFSPRMRLSRCVFLRQWYQTGGSDRAMMVHHLEFLRLLVETR